MREKFSGLARMVLICGRLRIKAGEKPPPWRGQQRAASSLRGCNRLKRPLRIVFGEQRQIEQPFAGVIDDVQREA